MNSVKFGLTMLLLNAVL